jgi:hypothetical protein
MGDADFQLCDPNAGFHGLLYFNTGVTSVSVRAVSLHMTMISGRIDSILRGHNGHHYGRGCSLSGARVMTRGSRMCHANHRHPGCDSPTNHSSSAALRDIGYSSIFRLPYHFISGASYSAWMIESNRNFPDLAPRASYH